ncbi:MAG: hypothetical protein HY042_13165 [Spirochaetia bacterium]|nr:hypothetical protein [Spirochaetia bacterium]
MIQPTTAPLAAIAFYYVASFFPDDVDTMLYVTNNTAYVRSDAFLGVMRRLGMP